LTTKTVLISTVGIGLNSNIINWRYSVEENQKIIQKSPQKVPIEKKLIYGLVRELMKFFGKSPS
jgi:hypothetical protein